MQSVFNSVVIVRRHPRSINTTFIISIIVIIIIIITIIIIVIIIINIITITIIIELRSFL